MTDIPYLTTELEEAGWMGVAAGALLGLFTIGAPGALSTTTSGFLWTKTIRSGYEGKTIPFGIGRLRVRLGSISAILGVNWYNSRPEVDIRFTFAEDALSLEMDPDYVLLARKLRLQRPDGSPGEIIGYDPDSLEPLTIDLPSVAFEFSFRLTANNQVVASVQSYHLLNDIHTGAGIFQWTPGDPEHVLVLPKFFNAALMLQNLFIDISNTGGAADFLTRFPEVYNPTWKGIGAKEVGLILPIGDNDVIVVDSSDAGFLLGFDGGFSSKCSILWNRNSGRLRQAALNVDIRNNVPVRGEVAFTVDFAQALQSMAQTATSTDTQADDPDLADKIDLTKNTFLGQLGEYGALEGLICLRGAITHAYLGNREVWGFELAADGVEYHMQDGTPVRQDGNLFTLDGLIAHLLLWAAGTSFGIYNLIEGWRHESPGKLAGGMGLAYLTILSIADYTSAGDDERTALPTLKEIGLSRVGLRFAHIHTAASEEAPARAEDLFELFLNLGVTLEMNSTFTELLAGVVSAGLTVGNSISDIFGATLSTAQVQGNLSLNFDNLYFRLKYGPEGFEVMPTVDEAYRRLFEERAFAITARDLPAVIVNSGDESDRPRPLVGVKLVIHSVPGPDPDSEIKKYGVAISLGGFSNAKLTVEGPAMGLVLYFIPDWELVIQPELSKEPGFDFLIPPICYATGTFDLNKPLPSIGGEQNRLSVDVGVRNKRINPGQKIDKAALRDLRDLKNYKMRFSGQFAWGNAVGPVNYGSQPYDFLFVSIRYVGESPLFTIGTAGVFGLGGLFGRNVVLGMGGNDTAGGAASGGTNAVSIANWIQRSMGSSLEGLMQWPATPTNNTWHPNRNWAEDEDLYAVGLYVKAGSAHDSGKTVMADNILLVGFPELWLALAGRAVFKPINNTLVLIITYDHASGSFLIRAQIDYRVDKEEAKAIKARLQFELGMVQRQIRRMWMYLGHYKAEVGGPAQAELFRLFNSKFYYVFDTEDLPEFGLTPAEELARPTISGPAVAAGALWQLGPAQYGPSWLNVSIYGGLGFNIALSPDPFLIYGDLYAIGYIQLKVAFFKAKLELLARLYGMSTWDYYRFGGMLRVRLNLPWPLDDIKESIGFVIQRGSPELPAPNLTSNASALARQENRSWDLLSNSDEPVPIDAVLAMRFNKPIAAINPYEEGEAGGPWTNLTVNEFVSDATDTGEPAADRKKEIITTTLDGTTYEVTYRHVLSKFRLERRVIVEDNSPPEWQLVHSMAAAWALPALFDEENLPSEMTEPHHVLYLNTFIPPELQFSEEALRRFFEWYSGWSRIPPCALSPRVCLLTPDSPIPMGPDVDQSQTHYQITFETLLGSVCLSERIYLQGSYGGIPVNENRLGWNNGELDLPFRSRMTLPDVSALDLSIRLRFDPTIEFVRSYTFLVTVELGGLGVASHIRVHVNPDLTAPCGAVIDIQIPEERADMLQLDVIDHCNSNGDLIFTFQLKAKSYAHQISTATIKGLFIELDDTIVGDLLNLEQAGYLQELLLIVHEGLAFTLHQACLQCSYNEHAYWQETTIEIDGNGSGPDALWSNQLLAPDTEYRIRYTVESFADATAQIDEPGLDEDDMPQSSDSFTTHSSPSGTLRTLTFRTEATPSQSVEQYMGFVYPRDESSPLYPAHLRPFLTLKNRGLIRTIYHKHYQRDALQPQIVDASGLPIEPEIQEIIPIFSTPVDQPLEDLMQSCLPGGQQVASSQICIWAQALETDTAYALQLQDTGQSPAQARFNRSFTTSRFPSLIDHAEYVQNLFATAVQVPIQNDFVASLFLRQTVMPVTSGAVQGFDHAIETLYRKVVNIDGGRLGDFYGRTGEDFVAYLVTNAGTSPKVWGIVIELAEPLLGKDGVQLLDQVGSTANQARGLYFTLVNNQERLVLRDRSGSRVVILNSANGVMFAPIQTYTLLNLAFDPEEAVEISVRDYVGDTLLHMDDTEQTIAVAEIMNRLRSQPALAPILTPVPASLTIPLPLGSFTGTLFKTSTTTASLVAPKLGLASNGKRQSQRRLRQSRHRFDSRKFPDTI